MTGPDPVPRINLRVLLTEQCNLACVFCHNEGQASTIAQLSMPLDVLAKVVRASRSVAEEVIVRFSGGEPTLHPNFLGYLDAASSGGAAEIVVISNAQRVAPLLESMNRHHSLRFSVNVPSPDESVYRRMTGGGDLTRALHTIRELVAVGGSVSLNTYWPASRTAAELHTMVELSVELGVQLKLLVPCQTASVGARTQSTRHGTHLSELGFAHSSTSRHVDFFERQSVVVRVQRPWCPDECRAAWEEELTLRVRASGELAMCLASDAPTYGSLDGLTEPEISAVLRGAVQRGSAQCGGSSRPHPIRRPLVGRLRTAPSV